MPNRLLPFTDVHQPVSNAACAMTMRGSMPSSSATALAVGAMEATKASGVALGTASVSGLSSDNSSCSGSV